MNPVEISESLKDALIGYLTTAFDVNRYGDEPALAEEIRRQFSQEAALIRGPYLESASPYRTGSTLRELNDEGVISDELLALPCFQQGRPIPLDTPLYTHQERALRMLISEGRSIVVASGTGSGKSESFLLPILNDLLCAPCKGVCAVLIYPLNALVNDQLDRLRTLLSGTAITFGRYTSELKPEDAAARRESPINHPENEILGRDVIRSGERLPNILITNYAMLEYLLLRPQDTPLFQHREGWRYIVLDEAHSYSGAQGIEIAMLARRLKQRLGKQPGEMLCVASSATLSDNHETAAAFASTLFGEEIVSSDVIVGEVDTQLPSELSGGFHPEPVDYLSDSVNRLVRDLSDVTDANMVWRTLQSQRLVDQPLAQGSTTGYRVLHDAMCRNDHLVQLRQILQREDSRPIALVEIADRLFPEMHREDAVLAASRLIELGASARNSPDAPPLLPARYHLFARAPQGIWLCINPRCPDRSPETTGWSRLFTVKRDTCDLCECRVFPVVVCRECGQALLTNVADEHVSEQERIIFHWRQFDNNPNIDEEEIVEDQDAETDTSPDQDTFGLQPSGLCLSCGMVSDNCTCVDKDNHVEVHVVYMQQIQGKKSRHVPLQELQQCPRCHSNAFGGSDVLTTVKTGTGAPLSILTQELYRLLPPSVDDSVREQPGEGRKLLTFYDSRQGAARFAAMLQDSANEISYQNVIASAIEQLSTERDFRPDFTTLRDRITEIVINTRLYHNDSSLYAFESEFWRKSGSLSRNEQDKLKKYVATRLLAETTTNHNRRNSMERLGILSVRYSEDDDEGSWRSIAERIELQPEVARGLVETLLDRLRKAKVVSLPLGVNEKDALFGRNQTHKSVVLSSGGNGQVSWIGKTPKHRNNYLMAKVLGQFCHNGNRDAQTTLQEIWNWLCDETSILEPVSGSRAEYRLDYKRLFFTPGEQLYVCSKCQSISTRNTGVCTRASCSGMQRAVIVRDEFAANFHYRAAKRDPVPLRSEEHTAQLDPFRAREYQAAFKAGRINLLSCSTTFEMGIDLGDLSAVVMNNVPPLVANYRQRAGRAGRRASGTAFILTWASDRPHDQHYFRVPTDIIFGAVRPPYIQLDNSAIRQRHVNSLLLGDFLRYLSNEGVTGLLKSGRFFDRSGNLGTPHIALLRPWVESERPRLEHMLQRFASDWFRKDYDVSGWLDNFLQDIDSAARRYDESATYYIEQRTRALNALSSGTKSEIDEARHSERHMAYLLERLQDEDLTEYLPKRGVLPSYSFPIYSVELMLPAEFAEKKELRLERDIRQAIREFAPGSEIVADKRIWKSGGVAFYRHGVRGRYYRICATCRNLELGTDDGIELPNETHSCAVCGQALGKPMQFVTPDAFRADKQGSGTVARQIVNTLPTTIQGAMVIPNTDYSEEMVGTIVRMSSQRHGDLLYVNQGPGGKDFRICLTCGYPRSKGGCPICGDSGEVKLVSLGHTRETNILRLRFESTDTYTVPPPDDLGFWLSLMYALIHGASRGLQIERRDLNGLLSPRGMEDGSWVQTIVLFDDVPGGAGHTDQIRQEINTVLREALRVVECTDCSEETSCYHCLRDYSNQNEHSLLVRGPVVDFLRRILDDIGEGAALMPGVNKVIAGDLGVWLLRRISQARTSIDFALNRVLPSERAQWTALIHDCLKRRVSVSLYLRSLPGTEPEHLHVRKSLQALMVDGLRLFQTAKVPYWSILTDSASVADNEAFHLEADPDRDDLATVREVLRSQQGDTIRSAISQLRLNSKPVDSVTLDLPPDTELIVIDEHGFRNTNEEALFGNLFESPVTRLEVHDPYLFDRHRIVNRLGAYVRLAHRGGELKSVEVYTKRSDERGRNSWEGQKAAEAELASEFPGLISFAHNYGGHDRSVRLVHSDGHETLIVIGRGLDFIGPNGNARSTYITIHHI